MALRGRVVIGCAVVGNSSGMHARNPSWRRWGAAQPQASTKWVMGSARGDGCAGRTRRAVASGCLSAFSAQTKVTRARLDWRCAVVPGLKGSLATGTRALAVRRRGGGSAKGRHRGRAARDTLLPTGTADSQRSAISCARHMRGGGLLKHRRRLTMSCLPIRGNFSSSHVTARICASCRRRPMKHRLPEMPHSAMNLLDAPRSA